MTFLWPHNKAFCGRTIRLFVQWGGGGGGGWEEMAARMEGGIIIETVSDLKNDQ